LTSGVKAVMPASRDDHLAWAKDRAVAYLDAGGVHTAIASMVTDLVLHDSTRGIATAAGIEILKEVLISAPSERPAIVRAWIEALQ
jgi:hypothetical protein